MIQWIHAGVGVFTLLVLCIFLIVYIGVFSTVTTRICGAPLPGVQGERGPPGIQGKAVAPGPPGPQSNVPGQTGADGKAAAGILTGGSPLPSGTGFFTGNSGNTGFPGPVPDLLNPLNIGPINFKFLNNGVGSDLDQYQDTGYFSLTVTSNTGLPNTKAATVRFVRLGKNVTMQIKQIVFNHGGPLADWINFDPTEINGPLQMRFFFPVSPFATTNYVLGQEIITFDVVPSNFAIGLFRLVIRPNGTAIGTIDSMRIQFAAQYSPTADAGGFPAAFLNTQFGSKYQPGAGTFGITSEIAIVWTLL